MLLPNFPDRRPTLSLEAQVAELYDDLQQLVAALGGDYVRFGWPLDSPLLKARATSAPGALGAPASVTATGLYQQIALSWNLETSPALLDFEISRSDTSGVALTVIGYSLANCFLDTSPLADSTAYYYKIRARLLDGSTFSAYSSEATATTLANDTTADAQLAVALKALQRNTYPQVDLTTGVTGTLPVTNGGTGFATATQGDLIYGSAANVFSKLAKDTSATRVLTNTGASNNPAWAQLNLANGVTGILPQANGGTGASSFAARAVMQFTGTGVSNVTVYLGSAASTTEQDVQFICPTNGTITRMDSTAAQAAGAGQSFTYTLRIN